MSFPKYEEKKLFPHLLIILQYLIDECLKEPYDLCVKDLG